MLKGSYEAVVRRVPTVHRLVRFAAVELGELAVRLLTFARGFDVPNDGLVPWLQRLPMLVGTYESGTQIVMRRILRPGMTVVDAGAHIGFFARLCSRLVGPAGRVLALEPHPVTYETLVRNTSGRGLANVVPLMLALADSDEDRLLYETSASPGHTLFPIKDHKAVLSVRTVSLDSLAEAHSLQGVDLVKLDIEGAEWEALSGMSSLLASARSVALVLEAKRYILQRRGLSPQNLIARLESLGLGVSIIREDGDLTRVDSQAGHFPSKANLLARR